MLFRQAVLARIVAGEVTLAFRRWKRPTVKAGGTLRTSMGVLAIDSVEPVAIEAIGEEEARRAGFESRAALAAGLEGEGILYRIAVRPAGADPRLALREQAPGADEIAEIERRLAGFDARSPDGAWTRRVLDAIAQGEGVAAGVLAPGLAMEKPVLKQRVRRLKELGLTESLETGYRLSSRGRAFLGER